jgi:pimeloyl-ACP methyl ester carboxylesterase
VGPPLVGEATAASLAGLVEQSMDDAGFSTAHIVGNSLGGWLALQLAARGRAKTVVALAPAGGWAEGDTSVEGLLASQRALHEQARAAAPFVDDLVATTTGRRQLSALTCENVEHIPAELLAHQLVGLARCDVALIEHALRARWSSDAERILCPVRIAWGREDKLLPWPSSAARFRGAWLPHADWVVLDGVGHCPQLDVPLETAELISGFAAG